MPLNSKCDFYTPPPVCPPFICVRLTTPYPLFDIPSLLTNKNLTHLLYNIVPYAVASCRYAARSARSCSFFMPAKTILTPGTYFLGATRNSER